MSVVPLTQLHDRNKPIFTMDAELAVSLRLAAGKARRLAEILEPRGVSPGAPVVVSIGVPLHEAVDDVARAIDWIDREIEAVEMELRSKPKDQRVNTQTFYRELSARALKRSGHIRRALESAEKLVTDDPEVARTPPPGATVLADDADSHPAGWRRAFQKRHDALIRCEKKARVLAAR